MKFVLPIIIAIISFTFQKNCDLKSMWKYAFNQCISFSFLLKHFSWFSSKYKLHAYAIICEMAELHFIICT